MDSTEVRRIARLARLDLEEDEPARFARQLTAILEYFAKLQELSTVDQPADAHPAELRGPTRPDEPRDWPDPETLVDACAKHRDGFFVVPRILE